MAVKIFVCYNQKMKTKFWIALSSIEQFDSVFLQKLYNYFGDVESVFNASKNDLEQIEGLNIKKAELFLQKRDSLNPEKIFEEIEKRNIKVLTFDDTRYPYMLSQISNPPMVLYYKGDIFDCNLERTVAFVGSRKASMAGRDSVKRVIASLKNTDLCIVSGLAEGIDAVSHQAAIDNNLKTIGVIASGFDYTYPSSNRHLYDKLEHGYGAVVTEYFPTFEPIKFRFPQRNRIVTGLSYGTVVGEAAMRSGALISANLTLEQGRELMCIPGDINNKNTEGIYKLIKNGASMITSGEDLLNTLNWQIEVCSGQKDIDLKNILEQNSQFKTIFDIICVESKRFDEIQRETTIKTDELLTTLTMMEMEGLIELTEGDRYKRA